MRGLHRRHHAELDEALAIDHRDDLAVLDAPSCVLATAGCEGRRSEDVEDLSIRAIADRMHAQLHAGVGTQLRDFRQPGRKRQAAIARLVGVGLQQQSPSRTEGAVGIGLHGAHLHQRIRRL